jgi:hypothetical protein
MPAWLTPIERALQHRTTPLRVFFRDDDAGWEDGRLIELLDQFEGHGLPLDLAVIPEAIGSTMAAELKRRARASGVVGLHQHGFSHTNHERDGRPCEFGPSRTAEQQYADLENGRSTLLSIFGACLDPIFTPPWNRCTAVTAQCLRRLGVAVISRDSTAGRLDVDGVGECPITIDWLKKRSGVRLTKAQWATECAAAIAAGRDAMGVMFHHAVMDEDDRGELDGLLALLARHRSVNPLPMREMVQMVTHESYGRAS